MTFFYFSIRACPQLDNYINVCRNTHWLRNANRYLMTTSVGRGVMVKILRMERARSYKLSVPVEGTRTCKIINKENQTSHELKNRQWLFYRCMKRHQLSKLPRKPEYLAPCHFPNACATISHTHLSFLHPASFTYMRIYERRGKTCTHGRRRWDRWTSPWGKAGCPGCGSTFSTRPLPS